MLWFYLAITAVLFFATLNLIQRKVSVDSENPRVLSIVFNLVAGSIALVYFLIWGNTGEPGLPSDNLAWVYLGVVTLAFGLFERFRFYVAKLLDASTFTITSNVSVLVAFLGALVLYSETLTTPKVLGGLLIVVALFWVSYVSRGNTKISFKGIVLAIVIWSLLGIGWMLDKKGASYFGPSLYNTLVWTLPILVILFPLVSLKVLVTEFKKSWKAILTIALLNMSGYLMQLYAVNLTEATKVIPIVQTSTLVTIAFGLIFLKERDNLMSKISAGLVAFLGVYLLVAF